MKRIVFEANRTAYSVDQLKKGDLMTVADLISFLEQFDDDDQVALSHDRGYTFGGVDYEVTIYEKQKEPDEDGDEWVEYDTVYAY